MPGGPASVAGAQGLVLAEGVQLPGLVGDARSGPAHHAHEQLLRGGHGQHSQPGTAVHRTADHHAKPVSPAMKSRVPSMGSTIHTRPLAQARAVVGHLLGQHDIAGKGRLQAGHQQIAGRAVGHGHRLVARLPIDRQVGAPVAADDVRRPAEPAAPRRRRSRSRFCRSLMTRCACRSRTRVLRPASSTSPAGTSSNPVDQHRQAQAAARRTPTPISVGDGPSPSRWMATCRGRTRGRAGRRAARWPWRRSAVQC